MKRETSIDSVLELQQPDIEIPALRVRKLDCDTLAVWREHRITISTRVTDSTDNVSLAIEPGQLAPSKPWNVRRDRRSSGSVDQHSSRGRGEGHEGDTL